MSASRNKAIARAAAEVRISLGRGRRGVRLSVKAAAEFLERFVSELAIEAEKGPVRVAGGVARIEKRKARGIRGFDGARLELPETSHLVFRRRRS